MVLRSCSAASLLCRAKAAEGGGAVRLLIDLLGNEADLTVIVDGTPILLRCARLPDDPLDSAESAQTLLSEIRRTTAAAHNQLAGRRVESLVLCGTSPEHDALAERIGKKFSLSVEQFDPFEGLKRKGELRRRLPQRPDRFAPLLGALLDELEKAGHAVDFLHPRRRREAAGRRNTAVCAALVAALLVFAWLGFNALRVRGLRRDVGRLQTRLTELEKEAKKAAAVEKAAQEVAQWTQQDVDWLDQLEWLSEKVPGAEDVMLTQLNLSPGAGGGQMKLKGFAKSVAAIAQMEGALRDQTHHVKGGGKSEDRSAERYQMRFNSSVFVTREDR